MAADTMNRKYRVCGLAEVPDSKGRISPLSVVFVLVLSAPNMYAAMGYARTAAEASDCVYIEITQVDS